MTIFWFRRDLRLNDNVGLYNSLQLNKNVLPIFIFDKNILSNLDNKDPRITFIFNQLQNIQNQLKLKEKSLAIFYGTPLQIFEKLINENNIKSVYTNEDYEPYAIERDDKINILLNKNGISFLKSKDQVIFEKNEIIKDDNKPYVVYTPYSKKWKEKIKNTIFESYKSEDFINNIVSHKYTFLSLNEIGFEESKIKISEYNISTDLIENYEFARNFPALNKTSYLGIYLRFGVVSIRKMVSLAIKSKNTTFLNELIWREFFMQILWHFPYTINKSFRNKYDNINWENNITLFDKWCAGKTGYPFVDAGMRELNNTGYMHNRVRMIVASFLCKHLLIDWRWGETYFASKLLDYEQASNVGNWQWAAGCGVDAAPYFRIFNPTEQIKKFDKDLIYIKKWIPELNTLDYPSPIVEHKSAREKCLKVYKDALDL